ncbi:hypothetical protein FC96_GL000529 [Secundilactobacillus kimchicus JCM 15530]|uniref:Transcobalamin-like C-terminal domain-containing protein n=2 Tax=Secundilactobacillus kimchicus TaxID=528209 RepID=A0A0R1HLL4_9LACO|nr:DUF4430 domain-containing protein [Secundilactobacillus kimchicus]KRK47259.1 hypothetical protein FC96_GL000529 [Secundilactobacillus kimchicus JCM 15530]
MSKRKITLLVVSLFVIFGLGFAGYSVMSKSDSQEVSNSYNGDQSSKASSSSATSTSSVTPEKKVAAKVKDTKTSSDPSHKQTTKSKVVAITSTKKGTKATAQKKNHSAQKTNKINGQTCSLTVRGPMTQGNKVMMQATNVRFKTGDVVSTVLKNVAKEKHVAVAYQGGGGTTYIRGISGLFEFDRGSGSGWLYSVNNKFPGFSSGKYKVKNGDHIQWLYTENLGKDRDAPQVSQR